MRFEISPSAGVGAAPQIVANLIEHLPQQQRLALKETPVGMQAELRAGRDGWLAARVYDWGRQDVLLKLERGNLLYQCSCNQFRSSAPAPCLHILTACLESAQWSF